MPNIINKTESNEIKFNKITNTANTAGTMKKKDTANNVDNNKNDDVNSVIKMISNSIANNNYIDDKKCSSIESEIVRNHSKNDIDWDLATNLLNDVLLSAKPSTWVETIRKCGLLKLILPEMLEGYGCEQNEFHLYDVYYHLLNSCDGAERLLHIRMSALFHDIGKPRSKRTKIKNGVKSNTFYGHEIIGAKMFHRFIKRFNYDKEFTDKVELLIRYHMFHYTYEWTDSAVRRFIKSVGDDFLKDLFLLREADRRGSGKKSDTCGEIEKFKKHILVIQEQEKAPKVTDLVIGGNDIMSRYNISPSRMIGDILKHLLSKVVESPDLNTREELFKIADTYFEEHAVTA